MRSLLKGGLAALVCAVSLGARAQTTEMTSGRDAQEDLMITVYNNNYGLVREVRRITLPTGVVALEFQDVAEAIDATSVAFKSLTAPDGVGILEQNYRYDLLNPQILLDKYVGRAVRFTDRVMQSNSQVEVSREGTLLSTNGGTIVRFGDEIVINPPGSVSFPQVPEDLLAKPTLVWLLQNDRAGEQKIETSYLTNNMNWKADYVTIIDAEDKKLDLTGWVTLMNQSGAAYRNAQLKLVAGDVQRVEERPVPRTMAKDVQVFAAAETAFAEKSFFEYHLYTLGRRTTLGNNETKQMTLLEGSGVPVKKVYVLESQPWAPQASMDGMQKQNLSVLIEFENKKESGLGIALPAGRVRVYKADTDKSLQLVGEDSIDHTPKDEKLRLRLGEAFDVVAERSQTDFRLVGSNASDRSYRVVIRNHKTEAIVATVIEHMYGDWTILDQSHQHAKRDAQTFEFNAPVPADGETTITYRLRQQW